MIRGGGVLPPIYCHQCICDFHPCWANFYFPRFFQLFFSTCSSRILLLLTSCKTTVHCKLSFSKGGYCLTFPGTPLIWERGSFISLSLWKRHWQLSWLCLPNANRWETQLHGFMPDTHFLPTELLCPLELLSLPAHCCFYPGVGSPRMLPSFSPGRVNSIPSCLRLAPLSSTLPQYFTQGEKS